MFRAALGFAIAALLLYGQGNWTLTPALAAVKADIASARPELRLEALLMPQTGTAPKAHRLHS
jgi:hypothetical protein